MPDELQMKMHRENLQNQSLAHYHGELKKKEEQDAHRADGAPAAQTGSGKVEKFGFLANKKKCDLPYSQPYWFNDFLLFLTNVIPFSNIWKAVFSTLNTDFRVNFCWKLLGADSHFLDSNFSRTFFLDFLNLLDSIISKVRKVSKISSEKKFRLIFSLYHFYCFNGSIFCQQKIVWLIFSDFFFVNIWQFFESFSTKKFGFGHFSTRFSNLSW